MFYTSKPLFYATSVPEHLKIFRFYFLIKIFNVRKQHVISMFLFIYLFLSTFLLCVDTIRVVIVVVVVIADVGFRIDVDDAIND